MTNTHNINNFNTIISETKSHYPHDEVLFLQQNQRLDILKKWFNLAILPDVNVYKNILRAKDLVLLELEQSGLINNPAKHLRDLEQQLLNARAELNANLPPCPTETYFPNLMVKPSLIPKAGMGLFTTEFLTAGQIIAYYTGHRHDYLSQKYLSDTRYLLQLGNSCRFVDPAPCLDVKARYINDPRNDELANVSFVPDANHWRANIVCRRDICAGEELFISYGDKYWMRHEDEESSILTCLPCFYINQNKVNTTCSDAEYDIVASDYSETIEPLTSSFVSEMLKLVNHKQNIPNNDASLLDVACGTGCVAVEAAKQQKYRYVMATDISSEMIHQVQNVIANLNSTTMIDVMLDAVVSDGTSLPSDWTNSYDVAVSNFGLIFFDDPSMGLGEMIRCVKPGGSVIASVWGPMEETTAFSIFPKAISDVLPASATASAQNKKEQTGKPRRISATELLELFETTNELSNVKFIGPIKRKLEVSSPVKYWERFVKGSPLIRSMMQHLDSDTVNAIKERVLELVRMECDCKNELNSVSLPACAYFVMGTVQ